MNDSLGTLAYATALVRFRMLSPIDSRLLRMYVCTYVGMYVWVKGCVYVWEKAKGMEQTGSDAITLERWLIGTWIVVGVVFVRVVDLEMRSLESLVF